MTHMSTHLNGCCVAFLVPTSLNGMVVLVAAIAENPRLPKPVRLDSTTHMRVHRAAASTTFFIHAFIHAYPYTVMHHQPAITCMLTYIVWHTFSCVDAAPLVLGVS